MYSGFVEMPIHEVPEGYMRTCEKEGCQLAKDLNIKTTPDLETAKHRFERFMHNLEELGYCEGLCIPLLELMTRIEDEEENR